MDFWRNPEFWIITVILSIVLNILSNYIPGWFGKIFKLVSEKNIRKNLEKDIERRKYIKQIIDNPELLNYYNNLGNHFSSKKDIIRVLAFLLFTTSLLMSLGTLPEDKIQFLNVSLVEIIKIEPLNNEIVTLTLAAIFSGMFTIFGIIFFLISLSYQKDSYYFQSIVSKSKDIIYGKTEDIELVDEESD